MKVLLVNASPHVNGCTARGLKEVEMVLNNEGIETENINIGTENIRGCISCNSCHKLGKCVFDDAVNVVAEKFKDADGIILGTPVYWAGANGTLVSFLDRLFYSTSYEKTMKVGSCVISSRRAGSTTTYDEIVRYFGINGMPTAPSSYWNEVHGSTAEDVEKDKEGLQIMRNLGHNMAFMVKAIALGKKEYGLPQRERGEHTNFCDGLE